MAHKLNMCAFHLQTIVFILFPQTIDEDSICLFSDVLPTAFEVGVLKWTYQIGDKVAIVGAGPVGLAILLTAQFYSPSGNYSN